MKSNPHILLLIKFTGNSIKHYKLLSNSEYGRSSTAVSSNLIEWEGYGLKIPHGDRQNYQAIRCEVITAS